MDNNLAGSGLASFVPLGSYCASVKTLFSHPSSSSTTEKMLCLSLKWKKVFYFSYDVSMCHTCFFNLYNIHNRPALEIYDLQPPPPKIPKKDLVSFVYRRMSSVIKSSWCSQPWLQWYRWSWLFTNSCSHVVKKGAVQVYTPCIVLTCSVSLSPAISQNPGLNFDVPDTVQWCSNPVRMRCLFWKLYAQLERTHWTPRQTV